MATKTVLIEPFSDGDPTHRPKPGWTEIARPDLYLTKIAQQWMDKKGEARYGIQYKLDRLPSGYALFERPRPRDPKILDRHLYGHPSHKFFDSPNRFFPHFLHLMENGTNQGCPCTVCLSKNSVVLPVGAGPKKPAASALPSDKPQVARGPPSKRLIDDEGTPDVLRAFLDRLKREKTLAAPYEEPMSIDWRAERDPLTEWLDEVQDQQAWVPRKGEIVLFVRTLDGEVCYDQKSKRYLVFDTKAERFTGVPRWLAGVVGQVPEDQLLVHDLVREEGKTKAVNSSGFRVEPYPDPKSGDKSLSKQHKYVPLHHIRPFVLWQEYLSGIPEVTWHLSILNAMKVASTVSLLDKFHFSGEWPRATVYCRAVYIGHELICLGDAVRIMPGDSSATEVQETMLVEGIKFRISDLNKASDDDNDDGHPYNSTIYLTGKILTLDKSVADVQQSLDDMEFEDRLPHGLQGYGDWYPRYPMTRSRQVHFTQVLGRCYERDAMLLWLPSEDETKPTEELSKGLGGTRKMRRFSSSQDGRIKEGKTWFWGDSRAEALDLDSLNSVPVSGHRGTRDPEVVHHRRAALRLCDKSEHVGDRQIIANTNRPGDRIAGARPGIMMADPDAMDIDSATQCPSPSSEDAMEPDQLVSGKTSQPLSRQSKRNSSSSNDGMQDSGRLMETFKDSKRPRLHPTVVVDKAPRKLEPMVVFIDSEDE